MRPRCVLVGPPGAGKSTVGALVAEALGCEFRDSDDLIVEMAGKSVPDIFVDDGEPRFRELERRAIATALDDFDGVLALGGGAVMTEGVRADLRGHTVVYLSVDFAELMKRVGLGAGRPLLQVNPRATLRYLLDERTPVYESVASHVVDTGGLDESQAADAVVDIVKAGP
jgi:shikimate kinase